MVNIKELMKTMEKSIKEFETAQYQFESVVYPRYEADKAILHQMKDQYTKIATIARRQKEGEDVSQEDIYDAIPESFR